MNEPLGREDVDGTATTRHAVNIGSVGKPKDHDPRACHVIVQVPPYEDDLSMVVATREFPGRNG